MKNKAKTIARFLIFLGIGIFFIWLSMRDLTHAQKKDIISSFRNANYAWIVLAIFLGVLSHYLRSVRWKMLIEPMGYKPRTYNVFFAVFIGYIANLALPRLGEVSRCGILTRYEKIPFNKSFGTVIAERTIDMIIFLVLFFTTLILQSSRLYAYVQTYIYDRLEAKLNYSIDFTGYLTYAVLLLSFLFLLVLILMWKRIKRSALFLKLKDLILGFLEGIKSVYKVRNPFLFGFYSIAIWFLYLLMAYLVFFSLPLTSSLGLEAGLGVLIFGSIGIMLVQGGLGIYPAIVAETLVLYSIPHTTGLAMGWLIWSSQTITIIVLGTLSLILLPVFNKSADVTD
ncbi:MAG: lysylphosphatidylglycerol synthase transmembrane domain-containing protein [Bacteroidales bacterium]